MELGNLVHKFDLVTRKHSPAILSAIGISGTIITAYLSAKAAYKASKVVSVAENEAKAPIPFKEKVKLTWPLYIPPVITGTATVTCIVLATRIGSRRTAALASAYSISDKAFTEYKEKIVEQIGAKKEQAVRDSIAQDRVNNQQAVIVSGGGTVLCYETYTGRYFQSDMESIKKAQNTINAMMLRENEANLNDFYYLLGLPQTSHSGYIGWTSDRLLELNFSVVMAPEGKPCIAFEYNYTKPFK